DYLGVGAVFATATKADAGAPIGLDRLREIRRAVRLPVVGIGGITADNAAAVIRAGAAGVAVITAVTLADDMAAAVRRIRREVDGALPRSRPAGIARRVRTDRPAPAARPYGRPGRGRPHPRLPRGAAIRRAGGGVVRHPS